MSPLKSVQCTKPINLDLGRRVPCGKCLACRISRTREWAVRIVHEMEEWENSSFVTLTYSEENLPGKSLVKEDLTLFLKRLRKSLDAEKRPLKYYACGEYGDLNERPHYHMIAFGIGPSDKKLIQEKWGKGFVSLKGVGYESAAYVAGYVMKKYSGKLAKEVYADRQIPFQVCSKALGKKWCLRNESYLLQDLSLTMRGTKMSLPRYYTKVLEDKITDSQINQKTLERSEKHKAFKEKRQIGPLSEADYDRAQRAQKGLEIKQKLERQKKGNL